MSTSFRQNVERYLQTHKVDNINITNIPTNSPLREAINAETSDRDYLNIQKIGFFEFKSASGPLATLIGEHSVKFKRVHIPSPTSITAQWCPFLSGPTEVGFVDLLPGVEFVFTAAMQGCALVVSRSPAGDLRVWHNQHPGQGLTDQYIAEHSSAVYSDKLMYSEYASSFLPDDNNPNRPVANAFVGMHCREGVWYYFAQCNEILPNKTVKTKQGQPVVYRMINLTNEDA